jgi:hypothetical protein
MANITQNAAETYLLKTVLGSPYIIETLTKNSKKFGGEVLSVYCPSDDRLQYQKEVEQILAKKLIVNGGNGEKGRVEDKVVSSGSKLTTVQTPDKLYILYFRPPKGTITKSKSGTIDIAVKPKQMKVVDAWYTAEELAKKIHDYVNNLKIPQTLKVQFFDILEESLDANKLTIDYNIVQTKDMSFFAETISAIKLAKLLEVKNTYIVNTVLKMPKQYQSLLGQKKVEIFLPEAGNYPLLDYYINYKGTRKTEDSLKISVKSKLPSDLKEGVEATGDTNTVKFQDLFDKAPENVDAWYNSLKDMTRNQLKINQYGPKIIAYEGVSASVINKSIGNLFPLKALAELLNDKLTKDKQREQIKQTFKAFGQKKTPDYYLPYKEEDVINAYLRVIKIIGPGVGTTYRKETLLSKITEISKDYDIINHTMGKIMRTGSTEPDKVKRNVSNLVIMAEKILDQSSKKESKSKYNFYLMFYDNVLKKQHVIYSVPTRIGPNKLIFKFYAMANWDKEYHKFKKDFSVLWIDLRGKSNTNAKPGAYGALGIAV